MDGVENGIELSVVLVNHNGANCLPGALEALAAGTTESRVECIVVERSKPRKLDKTLGVAVGGALTQYEIDYGKCLMCGMCVDACPTSCLHMGDNHDLSCYRREDCAADFVSLARQGRQTPEPLWMARLAALPWVRERGQAWDERAEPDRQAMVETLEGVAPPPKEDKADKKPAKKDED